MGTKVLEHGTRHHPSFVNALPNIIAEPVPVGYCRTCAYLAQEIRSADDRGDEARRLDHAWTAIRHVEAAHPSYGIHNIGAENVRETRQTYNCGGAR